MERSLIGILGASGKVGQLVCDYLVRNTGYIVKAGYRKTIPFLFNGRLRWQFVDIQDKQKLFEFCRDCKIIINCIGSSRNINLNLAFMAHEVEEIYIPQLQKTKNIALFLPDEILQIAKENDLETIRWYNILPNKEHMAIMKKAYQKLLQRNDIATEIQEFEEITRKSTEHVLIHGGFHNNKCWHDVEQILRKNGKKVTSVLLPGHNETDIERLKDINVTACVESIINQIGETDEKLTLVFHSMAGIFIYDTYKKIGKEQIESIYCVACCIPAAGGTMSDILKGPLHSFASFCAGKIQVVKRFPKILALAIFGNGMNKK